MFPNVGRLWHTFCLLADVFIRLFRRQNQLQICRLHANPWAWWVCLSEMFTNTPVVGPNMQASKRLPIPPSLNSYGKGSAVRILLCDCSDCQIYPWRAFTPGNVLHKCSSCRMASSWRLFSFRKKLTNTRLGISGDRLTRPIWGRFSTDISRRAAKGCRPDSCLSTGRWWARTSPSADLALAVRASRHDVVTYAVLVRRGGKHWICPGPSTHSKQPIDHLQVGCVKQRMGLGSTETR